MASPYATRAFWGFIPPLNLLRVHSYVYTVFRPVQSLVCWYFWTAESCVLMLPWCWASSHKKFSVLC